MDNQQGKMDKEALKHWFAGFFDGEGTIFVGRGVAKNGHISYSPAIAVNNTHVPTQAIAEVALKAFDVPYYVQWSEHRAKSNHAPRWFIVIRGWKRCLRASQALLEYLHTKRVDCENMLELCHLRVNQEGGYGYHKKPHTERQLELIESLRGRHKTN